MQFNFDNNYNLLIEENKRLNAELDALRLKIPRLRDEARAEIEPILKNQYVIIVHYSIIILFLRKSS